MICPIMSALVLVGGEHRVGTGSEDPDQSSRYENVRQLVRRLAVRLARWCAPVVCGMKAGAPVKMGSKGQATPIYDATCSIALGPDRDDADFFTDPAHKEATE